MHSPAPLPSTSLSARNHQRCRTGRPTTRYCMSFRDVSDLLAERVNHRVVRNHSAVVRDARPRSGSAVEATTAVGTRRYVAMDDRLRDDAAQRQYLWRAVDQDGDLIDILVQRPVGTMRAARRFFRPRLLTTSATGTQCSIVTRQVWATVSRPSRTSIRWSTHDTRSDTRSIAPKSRSQRHATTRTSDARLHVIRPRSGSCTSTVSFRIYFAWRRHLLRACSSSDVASTVVHRVGPGDGSLILRSTAPRFWPGLVKLTVPLRVQLSPLIAPRHGTFARNPRPTTGAGCDIVSQPASVCGRRTSLATARGRPRGIGRSRW